MDSCSLVLQVFLASFLEHCCRPVLLFEKLREVSDFATPRACGFLWRTGKTTDRGDKQTSAREPSNSPSGVPIFSGAPPPNMRKVAKDEPPKSLQPEENSQCRVPRRLQDAGCPGPSPAELTCPLRRKGRRTRRSGRCGAHKSPAECITTHDLPQDPLATSSQGIGESPSRRGPGQCAGERTGAILHRKLQVDRALVPQEK